MWLSVRRGRLLTPPKDFAVEEARGDLTALGAIDENDRLTDVGEVLACWIRI